MARNVISLAKARRPDISESQRNFCKELIGMGLARLSITAIILNKDVARLTSSDINAGHRTINSCIKELGYGLLDARAANTPFMRSAVKGAAERLSFKVRIA